MIRIKAFLRVVGWAGITVVTLALLISATLPRYEWRAGPTEATFVRFDRWTRRTQVYPRPGYWMRLLDYKRGLPPPIRQFAPPPHLTDPPVRPERLPHNAIQVPLRNAT